MLGNAKFIDEKSIFLLLLGSSIWQPGLGGNMFHFRLLLKVENVQIEDFPV